MIEIFAIGLVVGFVLGITAHNWSITKKIDAILDKFLQKDVPKS